MVKPSDDEIGIFWDNVGSSMVADILAPLHHLYISSHGIDYEG